MGRLREFDEDQILAAVRDQFWNRGYTATSLDDLMRVTGLGKGSIYGAFGDKHSLFLKVLNLYADRLLATAREHLTSEKAAIERLRSIFRPVPGGSSSPAQKSIGCFLFNSTTELANHDDEVHAIATRTYKAMMQLLCQTIKEAQKDGDLSDGIDAAEMASMFVAIIQGVTFLQKAGVRPVHLGHAFKGVYDLLLPPASGKRLRVNESRAHHGPAAKLVAK